MKKIILSKLNFMMDLTGNFFEKLSLRGEECSRIFLDSSGEELDS